MKIKSEEKYRKALATLEAIKSPSPKKCREFYERWGSIRDPRDLIVYCGHPVDRFDRTHCKLLIDIAEYEQREREND